MTDHIAQLAMEKLFHKNQKRKRLSAEFDIPMFHQKAEQAELPLKFIIALLSVLIEMKRGHIRIFIGMLANHFEDEGENKYQACADALFKAAQHDLVDYNPLSNEIITHYNVSDDVYEDIERYQYPLPMIIPPCVVKTNRDSGYLTEKSSMLLGKSNFTDEDICLNHINHLNSIPYTINTNTAAFTRNRWKDLEKAKEGETTDQFKRRVKAFERFNTSTKDVMAALLMKAEKIWITWKYDKRGRCYSQGYHVNLQSNAWGKAVIEFFDKETLNET